MDGYIYIYIYIYICVCVCVCVYGWLGEWAIKWMDGLSMKRWISGWVGLWVRGGWVGV